MKCEVCNQENKTVIVPSKDSDAKPVNCCYECALKVSVSNVFYDGVPIYHFKSKNGNWYYVFVDHNDNVPYIYPRNKQKFSLQTKHGEILFK